MHIKTKQQHFWFYTFYLNLDVTVIFNRKISKLNIKYINELKSQDVKS